LNPEAHFVPKDIVRKILLLRAFVGNPKLVLLEDPTEGLNDIQTDQLIELISTQQNVSVLYSSEDEKMLEFADKIVEIEKGKVIFEGTYQSYKAKK
jgi:ABC-type multidrug transport system ATPase subunit